MFALVGAFSLRDGYQGPRYVLTFFGIVGLLSLLSIRDLTAARGSETVWPAVVLLVLVGVSSLAATILMWLPDANRYVWQTRADYRPDSNK